MQEHEREIVLVMNCADLSLVEVFTNDPQLAKALERLGIARDVPLFETTDWRADVGQRLPHLFVMPRQKIVLAALRAVEYGYQQLVWTPLSEQGMHQKLELLSATAKLEAARVAQNARNRACCARKKAAKKAEEAAQQFDAEREQLSRSTEEMQRGSTK